MSDSVPVYRMRDLFTALDLNHNYGRLTPFTGEKWEKICEALKPHWHREQELVQAVNAGQLKNFMGVRQTPTLQDFRAIIKANDALLQPIKDLQQERLEVKRSTAKIMKELNATDLPPSLIRKDEKFDRATWDERLEQFVASERAARRQNRTQ